MSRKYGDKLRKFRRARGVTQAELAQELGFAHPSAVHKRETGQVHMDETALLNALAAVACVAKRKIESATIDKLVCVKRERELQVD